MKSRRIKEALKKTQIYKAVKLYRNIKKTLFNIFYPLILIKEEIDNSTPSKLSISKIPLLGESNVYISLTSFPERIQFIHKSICSIMNQDVKPNGIYLWLSIKQFPHKEEDLPNELINLKQFGLSIMWVEEDVKSYKKLVYILKKFPDSFIVTADDDLYYPKYWLRRLIESYKEIPNAIHCHLTTEMRFDMNSNQMIFKDRYGHIGDGSISYMNKILGGSGTLYPPHSLYKDVTRSEYFMTLAPTNDDIWFWAMAVQNNYKIRWIPRSMRTLYYVKGSQEKTPCLVNINNHGQNLRSIQLENVLQRYDLLKKLIKD